MDDSYYGSRYTFDKNRNVVWKAICGYLQPHVSEQATVLDIGAGYCDFINNIKAARKIALDINPDVKQFCEPEVTFLHASVLDDFPLESSSVDVVFASNLFEHLSNVELDRVITTIKRVLKEGGRLILIQPNYYYAYREYWDDYTHVKAFSHNSLADFLRSKKFKTIKVEKRFLPFSMKSKLPKSNFITGLYLSLPFRPFAKQMLVIAQKN